MVIWGAVVTPIQFLGNGIAMAGLVYYNLGGEKMHELTENTTSWGTHFWQQRSRGWKLMLAIGLAISCLGIIGGLAVGYDVTINLEGLWRMGAVN